MDECAALREQLAAARKTIAELRHAATTAVDATVATRPGAAQASFVSVDFLRLTAVMPPAWAEPNPHRIVYHSMAERIRAHFNIVRTKQPPVPDAVTALFERRRQLGDDGSCSTAILIRNYVRELWLSELPPPEALVKHTLALVHRVAADAKDDFMADVRREMPTMSAEQAEEWWTTVRNLHVTATRLFDRNSRQTLLADAPHLLPDGDTVSIRMIKEIHNMAMHDLLSTSGQLRRIDVSPAGSSVSYARHENVEKHLGLLVHETNETFRHLKQLPNDAAQLQRQLAAAAVFFSHLLHIHPFEDGNGRTARLALSFVLRDVTVVPISLYIKSGSRNDYVTALENSHLLPDSFPSCVVDYVSVCAFVAAVNVQSSRLD